jgi:hypothetical protein
MYYGLCYEVSLAESGTVAKSQLLLAQHCLNSALFRDPGSNRWLTRNGGVQVGTVL